MSLANGTAVVYLPIAGSAGASLWGSDVRQMLTAPDATADATTTQAHGTALAQTRRTCDPFTATSADNDQAAYGWAIHPGTGSNGMGSTATLKRRMSAGNHVATTRLSHSGALGDSSAILHFAAYRVGPAAGRARTLLGSVDQVVSLGLAGAIGTFTASIALPELVFQNDETIQYSFEITAAGVLVTGASSTFRTGTEGGVAIRVDFPELNTIIETTGQSQGAAIVAGSLEATVVMQGASTGSATAAGILEARKETTGAVAAAASVAGQFVATKEVTGASSGIAAAAAALAAIANFIGEASAAATAAASLLSTAVMRGDSVGLATAASSLAAVKETIGDADGVATVSGAAALVAPTVGESTVSGGGGGQVPDGTLRLRSDGRIEAVNAGTVPAGVLRIVANP